MVQRDGRRSGRRPGGSMGGVIGGMINSTAGHPESGDTQRVRVSTGVATGLLIQEQVHRINSTLARQARIQGQVVFQAEINKKKAHSRTCN